MHDTTVASTTLLILLAWGGVGALFFWECFLREAFRRFCRRSRISQAIIALGVAALVAIGGIKPTNPPLRSTLTDTLPVPTLTPNQCLAGFALVAAETNATFSLDAPTNAVVHTNWLLRGASRDAFAIGSTDERPWSFLLGTNRLHRVWVSAGGTVSFSIPFDSATGPLPDVLAPDHLAPFHAMLGIVPEANWPLLQTGNGKPETCNGGECRSLFWHDTTEAGSLRLTWNNALLDRDAAAPVSFQAELFPSGDFTYRCDFGETAPTGAVIGAQNNGGGESWTNDTPAKRVELRWRHFSGVEPGADDTDGDGLPDYDEVFFLGTDPARADSDGDGIADGLDLDPNNCDADGDGIPDGADPAWSAHPFLAGNAGFTNLVLNVVRGMDPPMRSSNAPDASALLDVGGLKIPLRTGDTLPLGLPGGEEITASLRVRGNLPVRLRLSPGPNGEPFHLDDPQGIFSHGTSADATAKLSFPRLSLVPLTDSGTTCLHEGDWGAEFRVLLSPMGWDAALASAEINGFELLSGGTLWLDGPPPPYDSATGTVTLRSPWLLWGTLTETASVHWRASGGAYCHACGTIHTDEDSCSHDADCAARFSVDADCDCLALFVRVNSDDDDLDGAEDRFASGIVPGEDDLLAYHAVGESECCCEFFGGARVRITGVSGGLRLWTVDGDALATGAIVSNTTFLIEATAPSPTIGAGYVEYDILDEVGETVRSILRRFTMANVQIQPDWNDDGNIDEADRWDREMDGLSTWHIVRRSDMHLLQVQNECPSDAVLTLALMGESESPVLVAASEVNAPSFLFQGCSTNLPPFASKNGVVLLLMDASGADGSAAIAYSISDTNGNVIVSDTLPVQSVEPSPGVRHVLRNSGDVEWDYSNAPAGAYLALLDPDSGDILAEDYGDTPAVSSARPAGTYPVEAFLPYLWEGGTNFTERTGALEIVDIHLATNAACSVAGSLARVPMRLTADSSPAADWTIEPDLPDGARLFAAATGGTGGVALSGVSNVWVSAGGVATNYIVRAAHGVLTNAFDTAALAVGQVRLVPDYDFSGAIDAADFADAATNRVFRIWLNNDNDDSRDSLIPWRDADDGHAGDEIPEHTLFADSHDSVVNGNRDRLDWFPLWMDITDALAAFPTNLGYSYRLVQGDDAVSLVWTSLHCGTADSFQRTDALCAGSQLNASVSNAPVTRLESHAAALPDAFLFTIASHPASGIVLVEGRNPTTSPLALEVTLDNAVVFRKEIPLHVTSVEDMFRFVNLRPILGGDGSPATRTNAPPNRPYVPNGKNVLLLHGFLVGANESRAWGSEFFKKLLRSGSRADFWMVTWRSDQGTPLDYYQNASNAFETASHLASLVNAIPGERIVMAHSLGNMVASSAICDHQMSVSKYFALNAAVASEAVDAALFDTATTNELVHVDWTDYTNRTWSACWNELFDDSDDRSRLTWRGRFAALAPVLYNFWSSGDEVLEIGPQGISLFDWDGGLRQYTWHKQEAYKGRSAVYGTGWAGWGFKTNMAASVANSLSETQLRDSPIFRHNPAAMFTNNISQASQNAILIKGIPALSRPEGLTLLQNSVANVNMNSDEMKANGWCRNDDYYRRRWLHSDIQNTAYFFTFNLFDDFCEKGYLK